MTHACPRLAALFVIVMAGVLSACSGSSQPISVGLSPSTPQKIDQGQTVGIKATVTNDMSSEGVSWSLTGPGTLSNSTVLAITYNAPAGIITGGQQVTVTATSNADQTKKATVQITVNPPPQIPFQTLASGSVGTPYSQAITLIGGSLPFQWSVYDGPILTGYEVAGAVPDGLNLNPNTGLISGTPTGAGTWYFEVTVTDAANLLATNGLMSIQIIPAAKAGNPVPLLNQPLVPTAVSPKSPQFTLHVSGSGFLSSATINFNRTPLATTFLDAEHLTALVPAPSVANAGTASVTVVNPAPGGGQSNVVYFQIAAPESTVSFAAAANSPLTIYNPFGITIGDFNEDGKPDLAIAAETSVSVFLGNGDGTFAQAAGSPMRVPSPPYDDFASPYVGPIVAADFNNSGHLGLAVAEFNNLAAAILLGNGDGTFVFSSAQIANAFSMPVSSLEPADFNADGSLDLAITGQISGVSAVVLGYGDGAFSVAGDLFTTGFPAGVAVGDFNGDGKLDAIEVSGGTPMYPGPGVAVSLGNGDGTFTQASGSPDSLGTSPSSIVACDFNGDGKLDVAVTDSGANEVIILLGNGDGTFGAPTTIPAGSNPDAIVAGDFNNDGKLDLAIANYGDGTVTLLLGNGDGTFAQASGSPYSVGAYPYRIAAADFNGDGKLDLVTANLSNGTVSILLQQ
jgi:VCBS repeat protein/putative Ig domain-containing protein/FG-GAP repeat protein